MDFAVEIIDDWFDVKSVIVQRISPFWGSESNLHLDL